MLKVHSPERKKRGDCTDTVLSGSLMRIDEIILRSSSASRLAYSASSLNHGIGLRHVSLARIEVKPRTNGEKNEWKEFEKSHAAVGQLHSKCSKCVEPSRKSGITLVCQQQPKPRDN